MHYMWLHELMHLFVTAARTLPNTCMDSYCLSMQSRMVCSVVNGGAYVRAGLLLK